MFSYFRKPAHSKNDKELEVETDAVDDKSGSVNKIVREGDVGPWSRQFSRDRKTYYWQHSENGSIMWIQPVLKAEKNKVVNSSDNDDDSDDGDNSQDSEGKRKKSSSQNYKAKPVDNNAPPTAERLTFPLRFEPPAQALQVHASDVEGLEAEPLPLSSQTTGGAEHSHHVSRVEAARAARLKGKKYLWEKKYSVRHMRVYWRNVETGSLQWEEPEHPHQHLHHHARRAADASAGNVVDSKTGPADSSVDGTNDDDDDDESASTSSSEAEESSEPESDSDSSAKSSDSGSSDSGRDRKSNASRSYATSASQVSSSRRSHSQSSSGNASSEDSEPESSSASSASASSSPASSRRSDSDSASPSETDSSLPPSSNDSTPVKPPAKAVAAKAATKGRK
jgi:hypothetical protein